jgi:hypothetical protein
LTDITCTGKPSRKKVPVAKSNRRRVKTQIRSAWSADDLRMSCSCQ